MRSSFIIFSLSCFVDIEFVVNVTWMTVVAADFTTTPCFVDGCCSNKLLTIVKLAGGESGNDGGKI